MKTKSKRKFVTAWNNHIDSMNLLALTPSAELSKEVGETIDKLKSLVVRVADDKGLK